MDYISAILVAVVVAILLKFLALSKKSASSPPGPTPIPFLGNIIEIARQDPVNYIALHKISKKFGDLTKISISSQEAILCSTSEVAKDLYSRDECLNRPQNGAIWDRMLCQNIGMGFSNGPQWNEIRKFTSRSLRQFGFGNRNAMAKLTKEELTHLVKDIETKLNSSKDGVLHFNQHFQLSLLNLLAGMIRGKRHDYEDPRLLKLVNASRKWFRAPLLGILITNSFPSLRYIFPGFLGHTTQMEASRDMHSYARDLITSRRKEIHENIEDLEPTCFTDLFLKTAHEQKNNPLSLFTDDQFAVLCTDLIQGGADTSSNFLSFAIVLLTIHKDVQDKVVEEIEEVIGLLGREPQPEDHQMMPYTQAVILEIHRFGRLFPILPPRQAISDFRYKDYLIKKGTLIIVNTHSCFMDEDIWEEPGSFRPERFLESDPKQKENVDRMSISFGAGKRYCFGEQLGKDSSFIYLTTLLQKFSFHLPGENYPTPEAEPVPGIANSPKPFYALVKKRRVN